MKLADGDIQTREVLEWHGLHLLHAKGSSCSQKVRIFLNLKGVTWESHVVDLKSSENHSDWFLGVNPRGLVPCLVHDGNVHIESNDIMEYIEESFPEPPLIPSDSKDRVHQMLAFENQLHRDLRVLTFRYVIPTTPGRLKDTDAIERLRDHRGTIHGLEDQRKHHEIHFWEEANKHGISDQQVAESVARFKEAFDGLEEVCAQSRYLLGDDLSVVDIAWYIYAVRLTTAGYPLRRLHLNVTKWFDRLHARPEFFPEVEIPAPMQKAGAILREKQLAQGRSLEAIGGL